MVELALIYCVRRLYYLKLVNVSPKVTKNQQTEHMINEMDEQVKPER